jgi:hypothetical protein
MPQVRTCRTAIIIFYLRFGESYLSVVRHTASTNMSNSNYYFLVTIRRFLFICGSTCRRAEHVEQRLLFFSYDSENLIYLWFDIPQVRTCRTAIIIFLLTIRRILFICGSTCRRAEHVEQLEGKAFEELEPNISISKLPTILKCSISDIVATINNIYFWKLQSID